MDNIGQLTIGELVGIDAAAGEDWNHANGGANVASTGTYQLLLIGEFRNEKKIGFNSPGRSLFDF